MGAAPSFYSGQTGFSVLRRDGGMAGIARGDVAFNLLENDNRAWAENASVGVSDLKALYLEYRSISAKVGPLEIKPWGRRKFHLIAPPGVAFQFYQRGAA